ncbi:MAG: ABC transporter ATP-binding protein [Sphaerochaetaceae bacterium]|jgi:ABC-2 type transport system ATP-binding protein|nr:ABC transporter ATP-binding protein [Sphaerochaetaceae bacterium]
MKLSLEGIKKTFGNVKALENVSLSLNEPGIYGLLGRNGAGKTTLLNIICRRVFPDSGAVMLDGNPIGDCDEQLSLFHMMGEKTYYDEDLKFKDAVKCAEDFYGCGFRKDQALRYADLFGLDAGKKIEKLSTGYKTIFKSSIALALDIPFVFFDEPVLGLDANHREMFYKLLLEDCSRDPKVIVVSTHLIEEVAPLVERFIILKEGKVLMEKSAESMDAYASSVTGPKESVESYVARFQILGRSFIGKLETAYIVGQPDDAPQGLTVQNLDVQRLFIELTNTKKEAMA